MQLAVTTENESLDGLVSRVYAFDGTPSASQLRTARAALTGANPYLRRIADVPPGTVVVVPELAAAATGPGAQDAAPVLGGLVLEQLRGALALAASHLETGLAGEETAGRETVALIGSSDVKQLRLNEPDLAAELPKVSEAASNRIKAAASLQRYHNAVLAQVESDLGALGS
jgi:hypothetical protein